MWKKKNVHTLKSFTLFCMILFFSCGAAPIYEEELEPEEVEELPQSSLEYTISSSKQESVWMKTGDYKVRFVKSMGWTFLEMMYKGKRIFNPTGAYQPVINESVPTGVDPFLGSAHRPEEIEKIEIVELDKNGKETRLHEVNESLKIEGRNSYIFRKTSRFKSEFSGLFYQHVSKIIVTAEGITEDYSFKAVGDDYSNVRYMYAFMHIFPKSTKYWIAGDNVNKIDEGEFLSDKSRSLKKDVRFVTIYDPEQQVATSIVYPEIYVGHRDKNFILNREHDNKLYFMTIPPTTKGVEFSYSAKIKVVDVSDYDEYLDFSSNLFDTLK